MNKIVIKLKDITKSYKTGSSIYQALRGISFEISRGEIVAIMGPSGSGKSTTMHIIGALDTPSSGQYFLNGNDVSKLNKEKLAEIRNKEIGFVFQSFNLLPRMTVFDNISLPLVYAGLPENTIREKVAKALKAVGLSNKSKSYSNQMSGGEIQRVAIARAIAGNPLIILADEPTGNLDSKNSLEIMKIFQRMNENGHTVIIITHEPNIAMTCERIIALKDGLIESDKSNPQYKDLEKNIGIKKK
jgi:putative ABC transport system ATP-binding protein